MILGLLKRRIIRKRETLKATFLQIQEHLRDQKYLQTKYKFNMNEAFIRYKEHNDRFNISFRYVNENPIIDRQFTFNRLVDEPINLFLRRIDINITNILKKKLNKKQKKALKQEQQEIEVPEDNVIADRIKMLRKDKKIDNSTICKEFLDNPIDVVLEVLGKQFTLNINSPWIETIKLPTSIMAGFPTYPAKFEALYTNIEDSIFTWYRNNPAVVVGSKQYWIEVAKGYIYTPKNEDIGHKLRLVCEPRYGEKSGPMAETETGTEALVQAGPGVCPFEIRHNFTKEKLSGKSFRVMSYNLLADTYADSNYSRETLFPYCPAYALKIDYRKQLFIKEILGFNSDIICLQEVDNKIFENDLVRTLKLQKYEGTYTRKGDAELQEGLAVFYNSERFEKLSSENIIMSKNVEMEQFTDTWSNLSNEKTKERFLARNTTIQAVVLKSTENPDKIFVVGNTHLYFHPDADHIRLLQGYYALLYVQSVVKRTKEENPNCTVHMLLCGDFNSVPECGIYELYTQNYIPPDFIDWNSNEEEKVENVSLSHNYNISSACGTPEYTNYTVEFNGCLDYIFYETDHLKVTQVIPMPSDQEVKLHQAIPSIVFPSDHISICADLELI